MTWRQSSMTLIGVLGFIATLLVRFTLANKNTVPHGWVPRILVQCGVPFVEVWDVFHEMYESQVAFPFPITLLQYADKIQ